MQKWYLFIRFIEFACSRVIQMNWISVFQCKRKTWEKQPARSAKGCVRGRALLFPFSHVSALALSSSSPEISFTYPTIEEMRENSRLSVQWPIKRLKKLYNRLILLDLVSLMFAFLFILGRTWSQWDGWPSGKLSARHAVMGTGKFGIYNSEDRAQWQYSKNDTTVFVFFS